MFYHKRWRGIYRYGTLKNCDSSGNGWFGQQIYLKKRSPDNATGDLGAWVWTYAPGSVLPFAQDLILGVIHSGTVKYTLKLQQTKGR